MPNRRPYRALILRPAIGTESIESRREFFRTGLAALALTHPALARLTRMRTGAESTGAGAAVLTLKPLAQYQAEAAQFESAMQSYASAATLPIASSVERKKVATTVASAAPRFELYYSALVATAAADSALAAWVKTEIRDEATFRKFVDGVIKDPSIANKIPQVDRLRAQLATLKSQKRGLMMSLAARSLEIAGREQAASRQAAIAASIAEAERSQAAACQSTWVIITAVLVVVVAATSTSAAAPVAANTAAVALTPAAVATGTATIAARYAGTGAAKIETDLKAATDAYNRCITSAATLPPLLQEQAIADCQAQLLAAQMAAIA